MNLLVRRALVFGAPALVGAGAGASGAVLLTGGAHESVMISVGDTLATRFAISTDTVLRVTGSRMS